MTGKNKRALEWAVAFWLGVGLMSIINVWKITQNKNAINYSWIMFGVSIFFLIVCSVYLFVVRNKNKK